MLTVREALLQGQKLLEDAGIGRSNGTSRLTAEVLLMHATGQNRAWLYAHASDQLREVWWIHYGRYLHERLSGKPTQHITGAQEFYGRDFHVTRDVLIPRPETEHLVEAALARIKAQMKKAADPMKVLDIGTGSGAIAITLALETEAKIYATDISSPALHVASKNAQSLGAPVQFIAGDLGESFAREAFDLVVSNPPYVALRDRETLQREVRDFEPHLALFGGDDGSEVYRKLIPSVARILRPQGWLLLELGADSLDSVREMLAGWEEVSTINDLAGIPRVVNARRS
jgi:release factor glutamine methyltransferase